jgi:RimJ/RimL family protein N-acetyltransferase
VSDAELDIRSIQVLEGAGFSREGLLMAYLGIDTSRVDAGPFAGISRLA